jgi:hypothetical protein
MDVKSEERAGKGLIWLGIRTRCRLFETRQWNFRFHKARGISWPGPWPLKIGTIGCPETSVIINVRRATSYKN